MRIRSLLVISSGVVAFLTVTGVSVAGSVGILATVNGESITRNQVSASLEDWYSSSVVDELIEFKIVEQAARRAGVVVTRHDVDARIADIRKQYPDDVHFRSALTDKGMTLGHLRAVYRMRLQAEGIVRKSIRITSADLDGYRRASQIIIPIGSAPGTVTDAASLKAREETAKAQADQIYAELQGGLPFEDAVRRCAADPAGKRSDGDMNWFTRDRIIYELQEPVFALRPGEMTRPIRTSMGYHIVRLAATGNSTSGDERKRVVAELTQAQLAQKLRPWLDTLRSRAKIVRTHSN